MAEARKVLDDIQAALYRCKVGLLGTCGFVGELKLLVVVDQTAKHRATLDWYRL
jgi:hypothetical protein